MGVDYRSNFGVCYKVAPKETKTAFEEHLDIICENTDFEFFTTGESTYTGEIPTYFVVLRKPFENWLNLDKQKKKLDLFLKQNKIECISDFGLHGGLLIY